MPDKSIAAEIVEVRDFLMSEVENREVAGEGEYLHQARRALSQFDQIVRAYRALKQETV